MMRDITKRLIKKGFDLEMPSRFHYNKNRIKLKDRSEDYIFKLKLTLLSGFIEHFLKVR